VIEVFPRWHHPKTAETIVKSKHSRIRASYTLRCRVCQRAARARYRRHLTAARRQLALPFMCDAVSA
jgi:hypothetical protein